MSNNVKLIIFIAVISMLTVFLFLSGCRQKKQKIVIIEKEIPEVETTIDDIWKIEDESSFVIEMASYIGKICEYGDNMNALNENQRTFYITYTLEGEVNNGGFSQFFFNSSGDLANEAVSAFEKIGANKTADICKKAVEIYGESVPLDRDEREALLIDNDEVDEILNDCDNAFFEYEDDLTALNYQFIINNKDSFLK